jgi:acyl carrier protein
VRRRSDGNLVYLNRIDDQVKVRGYRIEPGEIEAVLATHLEVDRALVIARDQRLLAYVVPTAGTSPDVTVLRDHVRRAVPDYLVPSAILTIDEVPLTHNGKVAWNRLPAPDSVDSAVVTPYAAPETPLQQQLCAIWQETIGVRRVGIHDTFFDLGGHSLLATRVVARVRAELEVDVPLRALFENPTVSGLAAEVESRRTADDAELLRLIEYVEQLDEDEL